MPQKEPTSEARSAGPELRLVDRRAFVGFPSLTLAPGVVATDFALQIPDVTFPLNVSGGAARYQKKKLDFGLLELTVDAEVINRALPKVSKALAELDDLKLTFRPGVVEGQARLRGPERTPVTFKVAFDGDADRLAVYVYDVRLYAFATIPASRIAALVADAVRSAEVLPDVERRGASGFSTRILPQIVEQAAVGRGFKLPSLDQARLVDASVSTKGLKLRFAAGGLPPPGALDDELLLALEGARAFADAEELIAQGQLKAARETYLRLGEAGDAHPFAVERLLTLLVADPQTHELALDVAVSLGRRRERSAAPLWAEAVVRERKGEFARASERFLALVNLARKNQEDAGAFFAAEAAARSSRDSAPHMAVKALHELLGLKPDHLPSLKALARASDHANDRAGSIRAYRRLAALARDPADAAEAHVQLARLCAQTDDDVAGARLHCEAALRLAPDHPDALFQLGQLCFKGGEHLRAIKALDRLREVALARHEVDRVGRANLLAGQVWELGLKQLENASLRYREAASLLPGEAEPLFLSARVAEGIGKVQEAIAGYQQAVELAGPAPQTEQLKKVAHDAHHALARLLKLRLGEPVRAREHLEAALALDPRDTGALDELLPYFRDAGKAAELADACERAASVMEEPGRRAALWAEAGELYRGRLGQPEKAERLLLAALDADPKNRQALEGMLALAESKRDGQALTRCLKALAELSTDAKEKARTLRRLAVAARDLTFDLDLAAWAYRKVLELEPDDLPVLGELTALERRRADMPGLAFALEHRARAAELIGDKRLAAAALRELGQVLDARLGRVGDAVVALEKAARLAPEASALLDLANLALRLERAPQARRALEDALALLPKHAPPERLAEVRAKLGRACELVGDREAAREAYALAFPVRRLDDELAHRLEALYQDAGATKALTDLWAARAQALQHAGRATDAAPLFFKSARLLLDSGDAAGAMLRLTAALDAAPTGERARETLEAMAQLEAGRGELNEAAKLFARRAQHAESVREAARYLFKASSLTRGTPRERTYLEQVLERDGTFAPARLRRAELLEDTAPADALTDLEIVLATDREDVDLQALSLDAVLLTRRAAFAALKAGAQDAARRLLSKYTAQRPGDLEAQLELAALHRNSGALEPLVELLGELWPRLEGTQRHAARREYAEGALRLGRPSQAADALRAMLADDPADAWAAERLLAQLPADDAHHTERAQLLTQLLSNASGEAKADLLARRAELSRTSGDLAGARADLQEAAALAAQPLPLLRALAELARQAKDDAGELGAWRQVLEKAPPQGPILGDAAERLAALARARLAAQDGVRALEAYELLVTLPLGPTERFEAWYGLAQTSRGLGAERRAEDALAEAARQGPAPRRVEALLERAQLLEGRQARDEAVVAYGAALALAPRHPKAVDGLTQNLRALADWEGLAEVLAAEAQQSPRAKAAPLFAELAALYLDKLGQTGPGEAALRRVVSLDAKDAPARSTLARLVAARGEWLEACQLLEAAAALVPAADGAALLWEAASHAAAHHERSLELRLMRKAHALEPARGAHLERLADALYLLGAVREALPLYRALEATASFADAPETAERALLRAAELSFHVGDAGAAEASLRRLVQERPLHFEAVERLARLVAQRSKRDALTLRAQHAQLAARTPRSADWLLGLANEAATQFNELDLATRLARLAAEGAADPLPVRLKLAGWLRAADRPGELLAELGEIAQLYLLAGDAERALATYDEEIDLAERGGHVDDALRTLTAVAELADEEGLVERAAGAWLRRAELLRDAKLDLANAALALDKAYALHPTPAVADAAMALARRQGDREAEIDWLERTFATLTSDTARADGFVALARLHLGMSASAAAVAIDTAPLYAPEQAEAALRQALRLTPRDPHAEALLLALLERQQRPGDVAAYFEEVAALSPAGPERAALLLRAAALYRDGAGRPHDAAAALLAARAADPDDLALTARVADLLHELGRTQDAADFDAVVLETDPFHPCEARHRAFLEQTHDWQGLAGLRSRQAERRAGDEAARLWLDAARAFRLAGAVERAQVCEAQAFEAAPTNASAFEQLVEQAEGDARRTAELLLLRARAVPGEAPSLLLRRAEVLTAAHDALGAAGAWDDYLDLEPTNVQALLARAQLAAQAGGPRAAQPYDRRLVQHERFAGLPAGTRVQLWLRLGQAAMDARAWRDAVDAFETAYELEPAGGDATSALTALGEAYQHLRDDDGRYRTTLRLAQRATGADADALYRQALSLREQPEQAIEALEVLCARHPTDEQLWPKLSQAYLALGRVGEAVQALETHAQALGGPSAARVLLAAADLAERELNETGRPYELRAEAARLDPSNAGAKRLLLSELKRRGDVAGQAQVLADLLGQASADDAPALRLELAALHEGRGALDAALAALQPLREAGPRSEGYAQAVALALRVAEQRGDHASQARALVDRAQLEAPQARATTLFAASQAFEDAGDGAAAESTLRDALALGATDDGLARLVRLTKARQDAGATLAALALLAAQRPPDARPPLWLDAAGVAQAAGRTDDALSWLERVATDAPDALPVLELAERFAALGATARAVELGFDAQLAAAPARALAWADALGDAARARTALWRLADAEPPQGLERLEQLLWKSGDDAGLLKLSQRLAAARPDEATRVQVALVQTRADEGALLALEQRGALPALWAAFRAAPTAAFAELIAERVLRADVALQLDLLPAVAQALPARRKVMYRALADAHRAAKAPADAAKVLAQLAPLEDDSRARAALHVESGELYRAANEPELAKVAFELALAQDAAQVPAVQALTEYHRERGDTADFVALAERLWSLAGPDAVAAHRQALAEAYEAVGRPRDAYLLLAQLEETRANLERRVALARQLGYSGEALVLEERFTTEPSALARILDGYLDAQLVPFAARLGEKLWAQGALSGPALRKLAERLGPTAQGAALAAKVWPRLLRDEVTDADAWTLFAETLRHLGRDADAALADGFGAALTASQGTAPHVPAVTLTADDVGPDDVTPKGAVELTDDVMPRLHAVLAAAGQGLGAPRLRYFLDPSGGAEAYLAARGKLVVGVGALSLFGPAELQALVSLGLALGKEGRRLVQTGPVDGFEIAAVLAFDAAPGSLALARVLAVLDERVRGSALDATRAPELLKTSEAFRAVAHRAVERLGG